MHVNAQYENIRVRQSVSLFIFKNYLKQIHKYKNAITNIQIQECMYKYANASTQIKMHNLKVQQSVSVYL